MIILRKKSDPDYEDMIYSSDEGGGYKPTPIRLADGTLIHKVVVNGEVVYDWEDYYNSGSGPFSIYIETYSGHLVQDGDSYSLYRELSVTGSPENLVGTVKFTNIEDFTDTPPTIGIRATLSDSTKNLKVFIKGEEVISLAYPGNQEQSATYQVTDFEDIYISIDY